MPKYGGIITINVGGAGARIGEEVWKQLMPEHDIGYNGRKDGKTDCNATFFDETRSGYFIPRTIFVDTEPSVVDAIRRGPLERALHPEFILNGKQDTGGNFANGHYDIGREIMDQINDRMRKQAENCDGVQGFIINHSLGGGTGSGLGSLILEHLSMHHRKQDKIACSVLAGDINGKRSPCESYNEMLATHWMLKGHTSMALVFENRALGGICNAAKAERTYEHVNKLIAKTISGFTGPFRFNDIEINETMRDVYEDLVPFPRLHFMTTSLRPISAKQNTVDARQIIDDLVQSKNFNVHIADFDVIEDKYMAIKILPRGGFKSKEINQAAAWIKQRHKVSFVEWCPNTQLQCNICPKPIAKTAGENFGTEGKSATMVGNNIAICRKFKETAKRYDIMYSNRAYVHQYVKHDMEEGELGEAREDLGWLEKDYADVVTEQSGGDDDWGGDDGF